MFTPCTGSCEIFSFVVKVRFAAFPVEVSMAPLTQVWRAPAPLLQQPQWSAAQPWRRQSDWNLSACLPDPSAFPLLEHSQVFRDFSCSAFSACSGARSSACHLCHAQTFIHSVWRNGMMGRLFYFLTLTMLNFNFPYLLSFTVAMLLCLI